MSIETGVLYVVATPLGNLKDITRRALEVLGEVDLIAAEDTRHSRRLLEHYQIRTPLASLHEYNEREKSAELLAKMEGGQTLALISDAGTPLVSDPGFFLVREARRRGIRVSPVPGPSALVCALSAAGLPSDRFVFEGFAPRQPAQRREWLKGLAGECRTLVFYESSHRVLASLRDALDILGEQREAVVARELTKLHEAFLSGSLRDLLPRLEQDPMQQKGEFVVLLAGSAGDDASLEADRVLRILAGELPLKQAAALAARITGARKNLLYQKALAWKSRK